MFIVNGHILFGYEKISLNDKIYNETYDCNIRKDNIIYKDFFRYYDSYIESIFFVIIPFFIMFICSLLIIFQIFETRKTIRYNTKGKFYYYTFYTSETIRETVRKTLKEERQTRLRDKDIQLCLMLLGTTFTFLILCLPTEINDLFNYTIEQYSCSNWFRKIFLTFMQQVYYAGHFYIYTLTGQLFRKHLKAFLCARNSQHPFNRKLLTNFNQEHRPKSSFTTTSFINHTSHRPTTFAQSNDPSQRLIPDAK